MTFHQFNELPVELRWKIFSFCKKKDLASIALVNRRCRDEAQPYIWASLRISWHCLEAVDDLSVYQHYFQYTKQIEFADLRSRSLRHERLQQGYKSFPFHDIMRSCNPDQLKSLTFRNFMILGGLQLASEKLHSINCLELKRIEAEPVDRSWNYICNFPSLKVLVLTRCSVTDEHFKSIGDLKALQVLKLSNCRRITGTCLRNINKIAGDLTVFEFEEFPQVDWQAYPHYLTDLENVKILSFQNTSVEDEFFVQLTGKLKYLTALNLRLCDVADMGLLSISTFTSLTKLDLSECVNLTDQGLRHIDQLELLEHIVISWCENITDLALFHISKLKSLRDLDIAHCILITDEGVEHVTNLTSLTSLDLYGCHNLTNTSLELISQRLKLLVYVDVTCDNFTIDGLYHLLALQYLEDYDYSSDSIDQEDLNRFDSKLSAINVA